MQVKKQQLELGIEQQTDSKSGKEYIKAINCHHAYLTYMQRTSCKIPGWIQTCASPSLAFRMVYSAYKLNKQGDNIQS